MSTPNLSYSLLAWCYDELAAAWSLGAIPRAKAATVAGLRAGQSVVFAGVGRGSDALLAANAGAVVTAVDLSLPMLRRLALRAAERGVQVDCCEASLFEYTPPKPADRVVANFVLNVFAGASLDRAIDAVTNWAAPDGQIAVADFAPLHGSLARRAVAQAHYWPVALSARALGLCELHALHDYRPMFESRGFSQTAVREFGLYRVQQFERR